MLPPSKVTESVDAIMRAYEDVGMRVSYCYAVRDQNRLVYQADEECVRSQLAARWPGRRAGWSC